jgi:prepilin-type N-terminal cleavage/methylation domain-containing protein
MVHDQCRRKTKGITSSVKTGSMSQQQASWPDRTVLRNTQGFTLLEIIIVIVITGIVFVPLSFAFNSYYDSQNLAQNNVEIGKIETALTSFVKQYRHLPSGSSDSDKTAWRQVYFPATNIVMGPLVPQGMNLTIIQDYVPSTTTTDALPGVVKLTGMTCQKFTGIQTDACTWNIWGL